MRKFYAILLLVFIPIFANGSTEEVRKLFLKSMEMSDEVDKQNLRLRIIELSPESEYGLFSKGYLSEMKEDFENAEAFYIQATKINPKFGQAYANLGRLMMTLGRPYGYAMDYYQNAVDSEPFNSDFNAGLCFAYMHDPNPVNGIKHCNKAVELNSKNFVAYFARASLRLALSDYRGSIRDLNTALKLKPKSAEAIHLRGLNQLALGNRDLACTDLSKAGEMGSEEAYSVMKDNCK